MKSNKFSIINFNCIIIDPYYIFFIENRILDALSVFLSIPFPNKANDSEINSNVSHLNN